MKGFKLLKMIKISIYLMFTFFILYFSYLKNKKVEFTFFFLFSVFQILEESGGGKGERKMKGRDRKLLIHIALWFNDIRHYLLSLK